MSEISDEVVMQRVKEDNLSELSILFERYHVRMYNYFLKLTFDKTHSQDLTQNLFYRIIKYRKSYNNSNGTFKSWIYQMARNIHLDSLKQGNKMMERFKKVDTFNENITENEEVYNEDDFNRLDNALNQLQSDELELIVLSRYQKLKYEEISKIKDISVSSIKVQIYRAIKQLKEIYFRQN